MLSAAATHLHRRGSTCRNRSPEGRSNAATAGALFVAEKAVSKHTNNIFTKLGLPPSEDDNRRVLAVLSYPRG